MAEDLGRQTPKKDIKIFPTNVVEWRNHLSSSEADLAVYESVDSLRRDVEKPKDWSRTKELAKKELEKIPANIIPALFERLEPYLNAMPGGHSKRHVARDFINSLLINQDPWVKNLDDVEQFIGIIGGTFHDIGNSVVGRYEEAKRFAGHAETGAFLFGEIAKDLLPQNLLKLSQFVIAAHTHYIRDIEIKKIVNGIEKTVTKKPYNDVLDENGNKAGIWLSQWADRLDIYGVQIFIRHAITKAEPTEHYDEEGFHEIKQDETDDFLYHFNLIIRTGNFGKHGRNILELIKMFQDTALLEKLTSPYSKHDTEYFTEELVRPNAKEQEEFIGEILRETPILSEEEIDKGLETFYAMCRRVDGGSNIEAVIDLFKRKFPSLPKDQLSHWANGFSVLSKLYNQMLTRMENKLQRTGENQDQSGIFKEAGKFALQKIEDLKKIS